MSQKYSITAKRFDLAKAALQGLLAGNAQVVTGNVDMYLMFARDAVGYADALLHTLSQEPEFQELVEVEFENLYGEIMAGNRNPPVAEKPPEFEDLIIPVPKEEIRALSPDQKSAIEALRIPGDYVLPPDPADLAVADPVAEAIS